MRKKITPEIREKFKILLNKRNVRSPKKDCVDNSIVHLIVCITTRTILSMEKHVLFLTLKLKLSHLNNLIDVSTEAHQKHNNISKIECLKGALIFSFSPSKY